MPLKQEVGRTSLQTTESFQVLAVKEGRKRGSEEGLNSVRGQEKIQYSVTQVALLMSRMLEQMRAIDIVDFF